MDDVKMCVQCWQKKPRSEFYNNSRSGDGLHLRCMACVIESRRAERVVSCRNSAGFTVHTHLQGTVVDRRRMTSRGLTERAYKRNRPKYRFHVPDWMMPKNGFHVFSTVSASIVWGICGRMADMPEYGES